MFVIDRLFATAEIREQSEMDSVVSHLITGGYRPALRSMLEAVSKMTAVAPHRLSVEILANRDPRYRSPATTDAPIGDLLFTIANGVPERCYLIQPLSARLYVFEIRHHCVQSNLPMFCEAVESAVRMRLDGRRVRGMNFTWQAMKERGTRPTAGTARFPDSELKTKKPQYSEEELRAARMLIGAEARSFLLQLSQVGKLRAADAKLPPELIEQLLSEHLLSKEYLVLCRKDSRTLCQVATMGDLTVASGGKLVCATCGRKFSDELVHEIFASTDEGRQLITSSRWMTIWLTDLLIQAGLSKEEIAWSVTAGEDEIDIMTDELGLRIIFELKDREFGLGDAYPFAYRLDRYNGNLGIVVSTDKVAQEAEKFFQEQRSKAAASIETLSGDGIAPGVRNLIDRYSRRGAERVVSNLCGRVGVSISPLVSAWMDTFSGLLESGRYKPTPCLEARESSEEQSAEEVEAAAAS